MTEILFQYNENLIGAKGISFYELFYYTIIKYSFARCTYYFHTKDKIRLEFTNFWFTLINRFLWPVATLFIKISYIASIRGNTIKKARTVYYLLKN